MMIKKVVLYDIKVATGVAIMLVVVGHLASRGQEGIDFYVNLKSLIYKFHMPLFLFLSGYISGYTYKPVATINEYLTFLKRKTLRLMPPYLLVSMVFFVGNIFLDNDQDLFQGVISIFIYPSMGSSGFLWYIYVLFLYYLTLPLIMLMANNKFYLIFTGSILVSFLNFTTVFSLNLFFWYLPYFVLGCFLSKNIEQYLSYLKKIGIYFLVIFICWIILEYLNIINIPKILISLIAIIAVHYTSLVILKKNKFLEVLGENSFNIYLFNTMFMGGLSYLLKDYLGDELFIDLFYYLSPIIIFSGIYFPIILYRVVKKRIPILAKYIN
jgi:fucose 4-O-acetylase-like acetyltransferase